MSDKCPTCFAWLPREPEQLVCTGSCDVTADPQASAVLGYDVTAPPVFRAAPGGAAAACPTCSEMSNAEACGYCHAPVPPEWRSVKATCVVLAGARATGKSIAIATGKTQLDLVVERHHGSLVRGLGTTDERFRRSYLEPLYEQRQLLAMTSGIDARDTITREPLIFQFKEKLPDGTRRQRVVVLRDVAGEDLENGRGLSFFSRADVVLALLDPLRVQQISAMLADLVPGDTRVGGDGVKVIRHVLDLMVNGRADGRTGIPIGVVLSKFDVLQALRGVADQKWSSIMNRPGSPLQRDPSLRQAAYDEVDGDLLHEEVGGLLGLLGAEALPALLEETADTYRFFAVSALGASPSGGLVNSGGVAPFRVADPFKWALHITA